MWGLLSSGYGPQQTSQKQYLQEQRIKLHPPSLKTAFLHLVQKQ